MSELILEQYNIANNIATEEDGIQISKELFIALTKQKTCPAMSANQIGYNKKVIASVAREPLYLVNPKIIERDQPFAYLEAHSSFPNRLWTTMRYASIIIEADNLKEPVRFGLDPKDFSKLFNNGNLNLTLIQHPIIMEACYIQQCIDTLDGIHPANREPEVTKPIIKDKTPGRNEIVTLIKGEEKIKIKYKKATSYISDGWLIEKS